MRSAQSSTVIEDQANTLADDFQEVVTDAQELLANMGTEGGAKVGEMKKRVQASIDAARKQLGELQVSVTEGAKAAATTTDQYVHDNPWIAIGAAAAAGFVLGILASRR